MRAPAVHGDGTETGERRLIRRQAGGSTVVAGCGVRLEFRRAPLTVQRRAGSLGTDCGEARWVLLGLALTLSPVGCALLLAWSGDG